MVLAKTIPIDGIEPPSSVRYEPDTLATSCAHEVNDLAPLVVEETAARSTPTLPRPVLPSRVAMTANYLPHKCGIATFRTDRCYAMHAEYRPTDLLALPLNDTAECYRYPPRTGFALAQDD